jgi:hypothetical protein
LNHYLLFKLWKESFGLREFAIGKLQRTKTRNFIVWTQIKRFSANHFCLYLNSMPVNPVPARSSIVSKEEAPIGRARANTTLSAASSTIKEEQVINRARSNTESVTPSNFSRRKSKSFSDFNQASNVSLGAASSQNLNTSADFAIPDYQIYVGQLKCEWNSDVNIHPDVTKPPEKSPSNPSMGAHLSKRRATLSPVDALSISMLPLKEKERIDEDGATDDQLKSMKSLKSVKSNESIRKSDTLNQSQSVKNFISTVYFDQTLRENDAFKSGKHVNAALISEVAGEFRSIIPLNSHTQNSLEYKDSFTGEETLVYIID